MTSCPTCSGPIDRDRIGKGDNQREVWFCPACVCVWPMSHLSLVPTTRKDLE